MGNTTALTIGDAFVAHINPFRLAGRTGGVNDIAPVLGACELIGLGRRSVLHLVLPDHVLEDELGGAVDPALVLFHHDTDRRLGVGQDVGERIICDCHGVDRDVLPSRFEHGEDGDDVVDAPASENHDSSTGSDALAAQAVGEPIGVSVELGVGERVVEERVLDGDSIRLRADVPLKSVVDERDVDPASGTEAVLGEEDPVLGA
jgi:hypothetical protein